MPCPTTETNTTSDRPIMSADAVAAVRPGSRIALRRASEPALPPIRSSGRPMTEASGRASLGETRATPRNSSSTPGPIRAPRPPASMPGANAAAASSSADRPSMPTAIGTERRPNRDGGMSAPSRMAVTGDTRVDRAAGPSAARTVTPRPTSSETITVDGPNTVPASGSSMLAAAMTDDRPLAMNTPATMPSAEPMAPMTVASATTRRRICFRVAPTARISASSRERWASVMDMVLAMVKAPTRMATPPNTSRITLTHLTTCDSESSAKRSLAAALCTRTDGRQLARERAPQLRRGHARRGRDQHVVEPVLAAEQGLGRAQVHDRRGGGAERVDVAEPRDARDAHPARGALAGHLHGVADLPALLLGGAGVDDDLVRAAGEAALAQLERGQVARALGAGVVAHAEVGAVADRLAVLARPA